jgi:hypothetical protein
MDILLEGALLGTTLLWLGDLCFPATGLAGEAGMEDP